MSSTLITVIGGVLTAVLGGGVVKGFLDYLTARRQDKMKYGESVLKGLYEYNEELKDDIKELRKELEEERKIRRSLENRVAFLESELERNGLSGN